MPSDLLGIPARKIQQALSMMSKADSCQAACYLKHGSMRRMIAGACTCLGSVAGDTRHLTRDPLLRTRSPSDYLKKPAGSWGNGSLTQCRTNMPHSHSPSERCPAVTMHVSALGKIFSIPAWTPLIIILATASAKLDFHNVLGKSSKIRSLPAGCRSIYWSVWGGVHHNRQQWMIGIQAESWMWLEVIAQNIKSTCIKSYDGNNSRWLFPAGWSNLAAYNRFILHNVGSAVRYFYMK